MCINKMLKVVVIVFQSNMIIYKSTIRSNKELSMYSHIVYIMYMTKINAVVAVKLVFIVYTTAQY